MSDEEKSGFKVTDKRQFTSEGDTVEHEDAPREEQDTPPQEKKAADPSAGMKDDASAPEAPPAEAPPAGGPEEPLDFSHLVSFLATHALFQLGAVPDPVTQKKEMNLEAASQMIDFLKVLKEKTVGNLTPQEDHMITGAVTELQGLFVAASGAGK